MNETVNIDIFTNDLNAVINHVKKSIEKSKNYQSKLNDEILKIDGMSEPVTRHLYNNMCDLSGSVYCEVGTWKGASFISAMHENKNTFGYVIDNWSQFEGPINEFYTNLNRFLPDQSNIQVYNKHCFNQISQEHFNKSINIYLFDGDHEYISQKMGILHYYPFFSKYVIIIVDDFHGHIEQGANDGITDSGLKVHYYEKIERIVGVSNDAGIYVCEKIN